MRFAQNVGIRGISNKAQSKEEKALQWGDIQNYNSPGVL